MRAKAVRISVPASLWKMPRIRLIFRRRACCSFCDTRLPTTFAKTETNVPTPAVMIRVRSANEIVIREVAETIEVHRSGE